MRHEPLGDGIMNRVGRLLADPLMTVYNDLRSTNVGKNCIINNKAFIEYDVLIGDHCHIATGAIVNGEVAVENESFIGNGAVTKQSVSNGNNCIIGAGVVVKIDIEPDQVIKN
jgi:carbonic anhydrase/acetyltransferase-like protein (isoleucine patch superfamily)